MGKNPNTGVDVSQFDCAITWLPMLLIEGSQQTRQAGSAIESFRNEMVRANAVNLVALEKRDQLGVPESAGRLTGVEWPEKPE